MRTLLAIALGLALLPSLSPAQPGPAPGPRTSASTPGPGPGPGPRSGRWGQGFTPGWSMMSPAERDQHREAMHNARTYGDCRQAFDAHRKLMEQRAAERGIRMPMPPHDACAGLPRP